MPPLLTSLRQAYGSTAIAWKASAARELAQHRYGIGLRPRNEQDGPEAVVGSERIDEQVQADGQGERLVRLVTPERHELLLAGEARQDGPVGDGAHRDVGDDRSAVARR